LLELDAQVLACYLADLTGWIAGLTDTAPARILDLGSGPGTGTLALACQFPTATMTTVDISPHLLHRLQKQAAAHGVAGRVHTLQADIGPVAAAR
jgi:methylase of polypeptide subunit release factors